MRRNIYLVESLFYQNMLIFGTSQALVLLVRAGMPSIKRVGLFGLEVHQLFAGKDMPSSGV